MTLSEKPTMARQTTIQAACTHAVLRDQSIDIRRDLGYVYLDSRCAQCNERITEGLQIAHSQWYGSDGHEIEAPKDAPEVR